MSQISLGVLVLGGGVFLAFVALVLLRVVPRVYPFLYNPSKPPGAPNLPEHDEAVIVVKPGGRIAYLNHHAREWFKLWEEEPNLERLARRIYPGETFLGLCAGEGRAQVSVGGRFVEATSYFVPDAGGQAILVSLRRPKFVVDQADDQVDRAAVEQAFDIFTELSQTMTGSLDLEETLQSILDSVERLIPCDVLEVAIWNQENNCLIPYRFQGVPGMGRKLEKMPERYPADDSNHLITVKTPVFIPDVDVVRGAPSEVIPPKFNARSYIGVPLLVAGDLIGTLEAGALPARTYSQNDLEIIRLLAGQAAVALHNALLYQAERRRALELAGLANLAKSVSALRDPKDLFHQLTEGIAALLEVEVAGFILFDETQHCLLAQLPFKGIQSSVAAWYKGEIQPGSPAEEVWLAQETIQSSNGPQDKRLAALGLNHLAQAAGIRQTLVVPLFSAGRPIGYIQIAKKRDGIAFDQADLRLLTIIGGQTGPMVENARLMIQSRRRAQRAETLRRITSLTGSNATLDEILKYSTLDLTRLIQADSAAIYLLDETRGELRLHRPSLVGIPKDKAAQLSRISTDDPLFAQTVTSSQKPFASGEINPENILPLYRPLAETLSTHSAIVVPLIVRNRGIGEFMIGSRTPNFFDGSDINLMATAAGQLAAAIEQAMLYSQTDDRLRQRVDQMTALARISRELNSTVEMDALLDRVLQEALRTTQADCGSILLSQLDEETVDNSRVLLQVGDRPTNGLHPLEETALQLGESIRIDDFEQPDGSRPIHLWQPAHPGTRSALVVPIPYHRQIAGLIHLHARTPNRFNQDAVEITESLAVQASIAISNAHRYHELERSSAQLKRRVDTLGQLLNTSQALQFDQPLEDALEVIARAIQAVTPFNAVLISVLNEATGMLRRAAVVGVPAEQREEILRVQQPWQSVQELLLPDSCLGRSYFIPYESLPVMPADVHPVKVLPGGGLAPSAGAWNAEDFFLAPLIGSGEKILGLVSVDSPRDGLRPDRATVETFEIFASQAALAVESYLKLSGIRSRLDETESELVLARRTAEAAQVQVSGLQREGLEQSASIHGLSQRVQRIGGGLDIAETVNRQTSRSDVLHALGLELIERMGFDAALVAEISGHAPRLVHVLGEVPANVKPEALLGQRNPLRYSLQNPEILLVSDVAAHPRWNNTPLLRALNARGFACLPIVTEEGIDSAILAVRLEPIEPFTGEDEQLFALISKQAAVSLQNLDVLDQASRRLREVNLLMDFSRQLGSLDLHHIMQTLVNSSLRVVPGAETAVVALWEQREERLVPQAAAGYADNERMLDVVFYAGEGLVGKAFQQGVAMSQEEVEFARDYNLASDNLMCYRDATGGKLPFTSLAVPIIGATEAAPLGVLMLECFTGVVLFSVEEQALISALTQQTALTLENARLFHDAQQRTAQLQALTQVSTVIGASLETEELVATLLDELEAILPYDTGTLWLRQNRPDTMAINAARGFDDSEQRVGLSVSIQDSQLLNAMNQGGRPIYVPDVRNDQRFPALMEFEYLTWLGLPLIASGEVIGVIALEKAEPNFYTADQVQAAMTFAGQAAVGLENATLYQESVRRARELDERSKRLAMLNRLSVELSASMDASNLLGVAMQELAQAVHCSSVSAVLFDGSGSPVLEAELPPTGTDLPEPLKPAPIFDRLRQTFGVFYSSEILVETELADLAPFLERHHTCSLLALPLVTSSEMHGLVFVHSDQAYSFSPEEVELARTITNQASIAIQNARLFAETTSLKEDLEKRVIERTAELEREHQRTETLLRIMTELSASLDLEQVLYRTLRVLNEIIDAEQMTVLILREGEGRLYRLASLGYTGPVPNGGVPTSFGPGDGLAGWVIKNRKAALIPDVQEDSRWIQMGMENSEHRSAMAIPIMVGADPLGTLLLFHRSIGHFSLDHLDLVQAAANQIAVAVNNAELYRLIRDQAEDLGNLLRNQQVETSRSRAILEAVADGVLVTDVEMNITLFNASAEKILGLESRKVLGTSLEYFTGLFGKAAHSWMETIHDWSLYADYEEGETYAEQIVLENGRVVSVHLAPVSLRNDFLGTVSIFQDITHQVEVDRLKSEFVATVSHELRTPMTSIKGYVEVLLMGAAGSLNDQQRRFLHVVKTNTERLTILVNDLLDVSRLEAGRVTLSRQALDLKDVLNEAIADLIRRAETENKSVEIEKEISKDAPRVYGDPDRIRQILRSLLENGYHYNMSDVPQIWIKIQPVNGKVQVDVKDNGMGIPPEEQDRIFERFFRGENPLALGVSGTGLGLSITQSLVQMHGGEIWLDSSGIPGEGSTFSFTLPVYEAER